MSILLARAPVVGTPSFGALQFVTNANGDYDHGVINAVPGTFGQGRYTFKIVFTADETAPVGDTSDNGINARTRWTDDSLLPYAESDWWFDNNWLLDGHNNGDYADGTFSIGIMDGTAGGNIRAMIGDNAPELETAPRNTGRLHGIQRSTGTDNVLNGERCVVHVVRDFDGGTGSIYRLYVRGPEVATETSSVRTNMQTAWWNGWNYPTVGGDGWFFGAEKQVANGAGTDLPDFKGVIEEIAWYGDALSPAEILADQGSVDTGHPDYLDHYALDEGAGNPVSEVDAITMTLINPQTGGFWP